MGVRARARTDCNWVEADDRLALDAGEALVMLSDAERALRLALPPIEPGDCWPLRWHGTNSLAGYAFVCPKCKRVHPVTRARNCQTNIVDGRCEHARTGSGSCWEWSGSLEGGTLTAHPSLDIGDCGWHGWLRDGEFVDA